MAIVMCLVGMRDELLSHWTCVLSETQECLCTSSFCRAAVAHQLFQIQSGVFVPLHSDRQILLIKTGFLLGEPPPPVGLELLTSSEQCPHNPVPFLSACTCRYIPAKVLRLHFVMRPTFGEFHAVVQACCF